MHDAKTHKVIAPEVVKIKGDTNGVILNTMKALKITRAG